MTSNQVHAADEKTGFDHEKARRGIRLLLEAMGVDPNSPPLDETWERRVPDAFEELSEGYRTEEKPTIRTFPTDRGDQDFVVKSGIPINSLCKHHLLPYSGVATVGYRPDDELIGLSKLTRYVRWKCRRLTTQEQLTHDISTGIIDEANAEAVVVYIRASHLCEAMRGVETHTETFATAGDPTESECRRVRDMTETNP